MSCGWSFRGTLPSNVSSCYEKHIDGQGLIILVIILFKTELNAIVKHINKKFLLSRHLLYNKWLPGEFLHLPIPASNHSFTSFSGGTLT